MKRALTRFVLPLIMAMTTGNVVAQDSPDVQAKPGPISVGPPVELSMKRAASSRIDLRMLPHKPPRRIERPERQPPFVNPVPIQRDIVPPVPAAPVVPPRLAPAPAPIANFDGLDFLNWGAGWPPDTNGDVGPNQYIQTINSSVGIYRKSDGLELAAFTLDTLMSQGNFGNVCDTDNFGDPVVLYDSFEDRWVITDFAFQVDVNGNVLNPPGAFQCFAVSQNGDPVSGGWNFYSIETAGGLGDYPKFGIWPDGLYMSANMFDYAATGGFQDVRVWAFNKAQMYAGAPAVQIVTFDAPPAEFTMLPSNARLQAGTPPAGAPNYFSVVWQFSNAVSVYKFHADWDRISASTLTGPFISVSPTSWSLAPTTVPSKSGDNLDSLRSRLMMQNQYSNISGVESIWNAHTVQGSSTTQAAVRYYQVGVTGGVVAAATAQASTFNPDTTNRFMPSVAVDRTGNMALGYSASSSALFPAIRYAGWLATDPPNTSSVTETSLIEGTGSQTGNIQRWGDYSAMTLDPDGCTFWYTNEYYQTSGFDYQTRIGSFRFPGCSSPGSGGIQGTVTAIVDGSPIEGATVQLGTRTAMTNASGAYAFASLPAGTYPGITVTFPGYNPASASSIVVNSGATTTQDFSLSAAAPNACLVDTTTADFQAGVPTNVDLTTTPGSVILLSTPNLDQQNTTLGGFGVSITTTTWGGQTFTPAVTGQLTTVDINLFCNGCTGTTPNLTLSLSATSSGLPTGGDLATATIPGFASNISGFYTRTFAIPPTLTAGTMYALLIRPDSNPSAGNYALTRSGTQLVGADVYPGGTQVTGTSSGTTWAITLRSGVSTDVGFKTYMQSGFAPSGTFVSGAKDVNPGAGLTPTWSTISWNASVPANTTLQLQAAASNSASGPFNFVGPDSTAGTFFTSGGSISQFNGNRYLHYKAFLATADSAVTPALNDVTVCYAMDCAGATTSITGDAAACPLGNGNASGPGGQTSYSWSITNGTIVGSSTSRAVTYTAGASGNVGLTLTVADPWGCPASTTMDVPIAAIACSTTTAVATAASATSVSVTWLPIIGATSYEIGRKEAGGEFVSVGTPTSSPFVDNTAAANAAYLYIVLGVDSLGNPSQPSAPDLATTVIFTDDPLVVEITGVQAIHIDEVRTAINAVRLLAGLSAATFTDPLLTEVLVKKTHVDELRPALDAARSPLALPALSYTDPTVVANSTTVKAAHVMELRDGVR